MNSVFFRIQIGSVKIIYIRFFSREIKNWKTLNTFLLEIIFYLSHIKLPSQMRLWVEGLSNTWWLRIASLLLSPLFWILWSRISAITQPLKKKLKITLHLCSYLSLPLLVFIMPILKKQILSGFTTSTKLLWHFSGTPWYHKSFQNSQKIFIQNCKFFLVLIIFFASFIE